ncbi:MAG: type I polyketide synthase [Pseudomonadota bacterium]
MSDSIEGIAIIGMSGRFPGAPSVDAFWKNIKDGVDAISHFAPDELEIAPSAQGSGEASFVCAKGVLEDIDQFDAEFFGYLPREAAVMDPQHRVFLEICSEAIEHGGYDPERCDGAIGVFAGCYMDTYILNNLCSNEQFRKDLIDSIQVGTLQTELGNDKDYLATRVAFKLGLSGPAMTIQTACSTSLVAIATACQSIENYQCDMALAGGVTIVLPQKRGYQYKEGGMLSPDGVCRPFDEKAAGTVFSNGAAVVLLKRAADAVRDGDTIYAVIRGYATNNDGAGKVSYTAPSVDGQADVISLALGMGGIDARSVGYVECHGTATPLGDPIEISGLTKAFRTSTLDTQFCAIGSVKANLGHLDCASGAIGLIKTAMALNEKVLPPLLHFDAPNPKIDFDNSPFYINKELSEWKSDGGARRAGVSSFGVGGTNAHIVLEEAPSAAIDQTARSSELILLSARTQKALDQQALQLAEHLESRPDLSLADIAYTLRVGRKAFAKRRFLVVKDRADAIAQLKAKATEKETSSVSASAPQLVFLYPGQGSQFPGMAQALYNVEPVFRDVVDEIAHVLATDTSYAGDIRDYILWAEETGKARSDIEKQLAATENAQPAIFAVECATAALLESWGICPEGVIGHSVGEFAGAVAAGVFSLADAACIVAARGKAMQAQPPGKMLAVLASCDEVRAILPPALSLAGVNAPDVSVVSGSEESINAFEKLLNRQGISSTLLQTSHAFHSPMMAGARKVVEEKVDEIPASASKVAFYSTSTGAELAPVEACESQYWGEQLLNPVLFSDAVRAADEEEGRCLFIEVGPGQTLSGLARRSVDSSETKVLSSLGPVEKDGDAEAAILTLVGQLWLNGVELDWERFSIGRRRRVPAPTYPFERKRHWIEPQSSDSRAVGGATVAPERSDSNINSSKGENAPNSVDEVIDQQLDLIAAQLAILKQNGG